jgi:hypothetical protein
MFGSTVLEIAVGLVFVYLVLSLVVTAASELIASWLKWRATNLYAGIGELLRDPEHGQALAQRLYAHPLISALSLGNDGKPSYIPSRTFAVAFLDLIAPANGVTPRTLAEVQSALRQQPSALQRALSVLLEEADHDVEKFKTALEVWFNTAMERVSGWYKRNLQTLGLIAAAIVTLAFNADTLSIVRALGDEKLRASILARAEVTQRPGVLPQETPTGAPASDQAALERASAAAQQGLQQSIAQVQELGLPVGWRNIPWSGRTTSDTVLLWLTRILGWLLTACAVSLGAPFWFDLLNRIMNIRAAGRAPEEEPKEPKEVPQPAAPGQTPP